MKYTFTIYVYRKGVRINKVQFEIAVNVSETQLAREINHRIKEYSEAGSLAVLATWSST